jgi:hypothetical protein
VGRMNERIMAFNALVRSWRKGDNQEVGAAFTALRDQFNAP